MVIHHLNCGTLLPIGGRFINGDGKITERARLVCHCLLIETTKDLILVDSGLGTKDVNGSRGWLHTYHLKMLLWVKLNENETALHQIEKLGYSGNDVRHIILTHLDCDHAGGIEDFPKAQVHVMAKEYQAAMNRYRMKERIRYIEKDWSHAVNWVLHEPDGSDKWYGIECVRKVNELPIEIAIIPLEGHTEGHAGIAVETPNGWLLHAGDAYVHHREIDPNNPGCTIGLKLFQSFISAINNRMRIYSRDRLQNLARCHGTDIRIFSSHDPYEFESFSSG